MSIMFMSFSSYSSFFLAPPLTPPSPPPSPQKLKVFVIKGARKWAHVINGRIVTLERKSFDVNREGEGGRRGDNRSVGQ
jgi:hypothetical protein